MVQELEDLAFEADMPRSVALETILEGVLADSEKLDKLFGPMEGDEENEEKNEGE